MASTAATSTGMYSGLQPAMTPLMATFSAVTDTWRLSMKVISACGSSPADSSIPQMAFSVGGTTGRPSVHPLSK